MTSRGVMLLMLLALVVGLVLGWGMTVMAARQGVEVDPCSAWPGLCLSTEAGATSKPRPTRSVFIERILNVQQNCTGRE